MLNKRRIPMRTKTILAPVDVATLTEAARREPVTVIADGEPAFVAVSPAEFERLARRATQYDEARDRLMLAVRAMQRTAVARGLTEEELERLLADES
jgi:PHD/YefM family antitoxin component YafN of YafNO toxin-antitoxin module